MSSGSIPQQQPLHQQQQQPPPPPAQPTSQPAHKHPRILACVLCQHRKIKCDRNTPCSNCVKAGVTCTPSTPAPARKRRRPNQDLQERLARCEELLQQYASGGSPTIPAGLSPNTGSNATTSVAKQESDAVTTPTTPDSRQAFKPAFKFVQEDGGARFMDSHLLGTMFEELQALRTLVDTEEPEDASVLSSEELTPDNSTDVLLTADFSRTSIEDLLPDPVHIFRLWQIYIDRVNPLTKIIHVPTVQPYVVEISTNLANVSLQYQALLFSIFSMAAVSLDEHEVNQLLGISREKAIQTFNAGAKAALVRLNFIKNYDMVSMQAFLIYLISLEGRADRHSTWILTGVLVRMAQKLGYHRDGEQLSLTPYETEMRRRIFWQLLMHDNMAAAFSGITNQFNASQWDTKPPSNINDADLFPGSMEPVQPRQGPTEMIFVMVMCEVHEFHKCAHHENAADFEAAVMGQDLEGEADSSFRHQAMFEKMRTEVSNVDRKLKEIEEMYCDPSAGNVHMAALAIRPMFTKDFDKILVPMREQPEWGTEIFGPKDNLFKLMVTSNEHRAMVHETMHKIGFQWFMKNKFQLDFFAYLTGQLIIHTQGTLSDRGWECVRVTYKDHPELFDVSQKANLAQAQFTLRAWRAREVTYAKNGWPLETPTYIQQLRDLVPSGDGRSSGKASANVTPSVSMDGLHLTSPPQGQQPSQQMDTSMNSNVDGFMDMPAFTWDMFGDMMPNNSDQFSAAVFGGYGLGNMNMGNLGGMGGMGNMGNMGGNPNNMGGM